MVAHAEPSRPSLMPSDVASQMSSIDVAAKQVPRPGLNKLPTEVVHNLVDHLHGPQAVVDLAALAVTCRNLLNQLGRDCLSLNTLDKNRLLERIEKDGSLLPRIYCLHCNMFHAPNVPETTHITSPLPSLLELTAKTPSTRECANPKHKTLMQPALLPEHLNWHAVHTIMAHHRASNTAFLPSHFDHASVRSVGQRSKWRSWAGLPSQWRMRTTHELRIADNNLLDETEKVDNHLFLKTEYLIYRPRSISSSLAKFIGPRPSICPRAIVNEILHDSGICSDKSWHIEFGSKITCGGKTGCQCHAFRVRSCDHCYTDCTLGVVRLPNHLGDACFATIWRDLGPGEHDSAVCGREWKSFDCNKRSFLHCYQKRGCWGDVDPDTATIYMKYEFDDPERAMASSGYYTPQIKESDFRRETR